MKGKTQQIKPLLFLAKVCWFINKTLGVLGGYKLGVFDWHIGEVTGS